MIFKVSIKISHEIVRITGRRMVKIRTKALETIIRVLMVILVGIIKRKPQALVEIQ